MYANGGSYYRWPDDFAICKMEALVKFLKQPTGYFYKSNDANHSSGPDEVHWLFNGQDYCYWTDIGAYVWTKCTPYVFPLNEWLDVTWSDSLGGSYSQITVAG